MAKIIAGINMSIDGFCDHTGMLPDQEIHDHYTQLLNESGLILYGRTTYELMQFWQPLVKNPSGEKSMDDFAMAIDKIPKVVFSNKLQNTGWDSARLADKPLEETVIELKKQAGKDILVGSRSLIVQLTNLRLIDEYQLCIHPVLAAQGLPLFENVKDRAVFTLLNTKIFHSGATLLYYKPA